MLSYQVNHYDILSLFCSLLPVSCALFSTVWLQTYLILTTSFIKIASCCLVMTIASLFYSIRQCFSVQLFHSLLVSSFFHLYNLSLASLLIFVILTFSFITSLFFRSVIVLFCYISLLLSQFIMLLFIYSADHFL